MAIFNSYVSLPEGILHGFVCPFIWAIFLSVSGWWSPTGNHSLQDRSSGPSHTKIIVAAVFFWGVAWISWIWKDLELQTNHVFTTVIFPWGLCFMAFFCMERIYIAKGLVFRNTMTIWLKDGKWFFWSQLFQVLSSDQWPSTHRVLWFFGRAPWTLVCENCGGMRRVYPDIVSNRDI